jgi:hypothetical protein
MMTPREAKPFMRGFELCDCSESVIVTRLTGDPMTFLLAIPCLAVSPRRSFPAKMGALANKVSNGQKAIEFKRGDTEIRTHYEGSAEA